MDRLKNNSIARICLLFTNLTWYLFLILGALAPITLLLAYVGGIPQQLNADIILPLNQSTVSLNSDINPSAISIESAQGQLDISYFAQQFPDDYLSFTIFALILLGMILTGLYQLKQLLQTTLDERVFTEKNVNRIKTIALLIFLVDPLYWIYHNFFFYGLFADTSAHQISLTISSPTFNYWFIGLLIYVLAAVFEKGHRMYQELKLTV